MFLRSAKQVFKKEGHLVNRVPFMIKISSNDGSTCIKVPHLKTVICPKEYNG